MDQTLKIKWGFKYVSQKLYIVYYINIFLIFSMPRTKNAANKKKKSTINDQGPQVQIPLAFIDGKGKIRINLFSKMCKCSSD